jgi:putative acetyltransferase
VVELEVNEANVRARRFYDCEGFAAVGRGVNPQSGLPTLKLRWDREG